TQEVGVPPRVFLLGIAQVRDCSTPISVRRSLPGSGSGGRSSGQLGANDAMAYAMQHEENTRGQMSVVVPFPSRAGARGRVRTARSQAEYLGRSLGVISWVRPASCECCGRPTLAGQSRVARMTLCGHCSPPNVA